MHHHHVFRAESLKYLCDRPAKRPVIDADQLSGQSGWIGHWPQYIEQGSHTQFLARHYHMPHGTVMHLREHEANSQLINTAAYLLRRDIQSHTGGLQHISATGV